MDDVVLYEVSDGIAKITLNRPDQMNAWTGELSDELQARLGEADRDDEAVVVVITKFYFFLPSPMHFWDQYQH